MTRPRGFPRTARMGMLALAATLAGCFTSPSPGDLARHENGAGFEVRVTMLSGVRHSGELLSVTDSTLVMITGSRVATGRLADIETAAIDVGQPTRMVVARGGWTTEVVSRARLSSRFAWGMTPAALASLLAVTGQREPGSLLDRVP